MTTFAPRIGVPVNPDWLLHGVSTRPSPTTGSTTPLGETNTPGPDWSTAGQMNFGAAVAVVAEAVLVVPAVGTPPRAAAVGRALPPRERGPGRVPRAERECR